MVFFINNLYNVLRSTKSAEGTVILTQQYVTSIFCCHSDPTIIVDPGRIYISLSF